MKRINLYNKKIKFKPWFRVALAVALFSGMILSIIEIWLSMKRVNESNGDLLYSYKINENIKYSVDLFENNFIDTTTMEEGKTYISDLIKQINMNFIYTYSGSKNINLKYNYEIMGKLVGENISNSLEEVVWEKKYEILPIIEKTLDDTSGFTINESFAVDYPLYKQEVIEFKKKFGMVLTNKLNIIMTINITSDGELVDSRKMKVIIPVGIQAFAITKDYKDSFQNDIYDTTTKIEFKDVSHFLNGIMRFTICLIIFVFSFKLIFNLRPQNYYNKKLRKILKTYGNIIIEVDNAIIEKDYQIIDVKSFDEMIDLEEELRIPIMFNEIDKNRYGIFTLINDKILYKYILQNK